MPVEIDAPIISNIGHQDIQDLHILAFSMTGLKDVVIGLYLIFKWASFIAAEEIYGC